MCAPVECLSCGKTTWAGCGQHVDDVMRGVPASERCVCQVGDAPSADGGLGRFFSGR